MLNNQIMQKLMSSVDGEKVVEFERELIRRPSFTHEEDRLALFLYEYFESCGLESELQGTRIDDNRAGVQPIGRLRGSGGGKSLLMSGHMDYTGLADPDTWEHPPFEGQVVDGYIYGRGAKDEKGGICAAVMAAEAIIKAGIQLRGDLIIAPVMGHKTLDAGGDIGARHLMRSGIKADMAIATENSDLGVATCSVGQVTAKLHLQNTAYVPGPQPFGDTLPGDLYLNLRKLLATLGENFKKIPPNNWLSYEPNPKYPGFPALQYLGLETKGERGSGSDCLTMRLHIKTVPGQTESSVGKDLTDVLKDLERQDSSVKTSVEILPGSRMAHEISEEDPLVQALIESHGKVRGKSPVVGLGPRHGYISGGAIFWEAGIKQVVDYGPGTLGSDFPDKPDECISIKDIVDCTKIYAITIASLCM